MVESVPVPGVECLDELGRGARTAVYRARRDGREYAVKVLRSVGDQREAVAFRREAALLASLDHPGLARVHDVGEAAGHPYLIMDLVAGRPLAEVLRQEGQLDEARAARIGAEVADALAAAHRAGLVHRDVKPDNIMIGPDGRARVIDFGFAARTGDDVADVAVGTFAYSAPEQTGMLRRAVDGRADLYALGVVLFECLTGTLPFVATETGELIRMHLAVPAPDVQTARPAVSAALAAVLAALLAKDPDDRYQSGAGLRRDLLRVAAGESDAFPLSTGVTRAVDEDDLVGRDDQRARLVGRWQRVGQGRGGGVVLVEGPPGAGKSRLVRELTGTVAASGGLVLYGRCGAGEALPLAPLRAAVDGYVHAVERLDDPARHLAEERLRAATGHAAGNAAGLLTPLSPGLSRLLRSPALPGHDDQRQFVDAVAAFLVALAGGAGGAVLHLDDVQWWDEATRQVVRRLVPLLADSALLVVVTARDDPQLDGFVADVAAGCDLRLALAPLDEAAVGRLVAGRLGPLTVSPALVTRLAARGGGNPLAVGEYIRALIDTGLVRPSWGEWVLDESGLDALALPEDIMTLVLRRVDGLGAQARRMLTVAAVAGRRFSPDLVAAVSGVAADEVERAFVEAATHQLIEPADGGGYVFLHDRIQEALLSDVDDIEQRRLHRRIAEELDRAGTGQVYALARHHLRGEPERAPERAVAAAAAAGALALAEHAPADAVDYLSQAVAVATAAELTLDAGFHVDLGVAASRIGRYALADTHLRQALDVEPDAMRRAAIYGLLAEVHHSQWEGDRAVEMAMRGLAELGRRPPRNPLALAVSTLALFAAGLLVGQLPSGVRAVRGAARDRYRLRAHLANIAAQSAAVAVRLSLMTALVLRSQFLVNRLGPGPEYATIQAGLAVVARTLGMRRVAERILGRVAAAVPPDDARLAAHVEYMHGVVRDAAPPVGPRSGEYMRRALASHGRLLDLGEYLTGIGVLGQIQLIRGYVDDAAQWHQLGLSRAPAAGELLGSLFATLAPQIAALAGRPAEAAAQLQQIRDFLATTPENRGQRISVAVAAVHLAVEQGATGPEFDEAIAEFAALRVRPAMVWSFQRAFWIHQAFGRLAQAAAAPADERPTRLKTARRAVVALRRAADGPVLRAYHGTARASLRQLRGDHAGALRELARLQIWAGELNLPLLGFEMARVRARAYRALGHSTEADQAAGVALTLATEHGWHARARWIRSEYGLRTTSHSPSSTTVGGDIHRRRLEALQQVSLAAATVLEPDQLTRVTLDEIRAGSRSWSPAARRAPPSGPAAPSCTTCAAPWSPR
ncbi:MAG: hypothetical protein AUI14_17195 [Actinobacteria bacterium 13_2_20CM_2_71_6]|nr:MAG: hypothetical protein AUI14_17195 [Actinobacteria bacterium 13_2_20CM_2_71_6]